MILELLSLNWNNVTIAGIIIGILIILYFVFRVSMGFINPFNAIDKIVLIIGLITLLMVFGYSFLQNLLYTDIGKLIFFGALILITAYFILFYNGKHKIGGSSKRKSSSYTTIVTRK